jgi:hypothetical protein
MVSLVSQLFAYIIMIFDTCSPYAKTRLNARWSIGKYGTTFQMFQMAPL